MADMPRPRPLYTQHEITRHGKRVWYFRRGSGPRIRLRGDYGSDEWKADYDAALGGSPRPSQPRQSGGTLGWLIDRYYGSVAFAGLAEGTKIQRRSILNAVKAKGGHWTLSQVTKKKIAESRDTRRATPYAAANFIKAMKVMFKWAVESDLMASNPAEDFSSRGPKTEGHHTWTIEEVQQFWRRWPLGTTPRLAMDIMLFTGMRISDAVQFGRQHIRDGWIAYRSQKTDVQVDLPLLDPLAMSIERAAMPGQMAFICNERGKPFTSAGSLGNRMRVWCDAAGLPQCSSHGLRKAGATIAGENGASDLQLMAYWGWTDPKQAAHYTRRANRARLAGDAAKYLLIDESGTSIPAPEHPVRVPERISQRKQR